MAEITLPDLSLVWASAGDILQPTDSKVLQGWAPEIPPRQWFNWLDNRQDQALLHIAQHGIVVWQDNIEYQAGKSYVQGSNGKIYFALQTNTNQNPVTDTSETYWANTNGSGFAVFSTPGTSSWNVPLILRLGLKKANVEVYGAGGGGGRRSTSPGASGGAQGGISYNSVDLTGITSVSVTVGAGGTGATADGTNGSNGTSSSFGTYASATGGAGGVGDGTSAASTGGIGSGGQWNLRGAYGAPGVVGGAGGLFGGTGGGGSSPTAAVGGAPTQPGHGGGGRTTAVGETGANGLVIIRW